MPNKKPSYRLDSTRLTGMLLMIHPQQVPNFSTDFQAKPKISRLAGCKFAKQQPPEKFRLSNGTVTPMTYIHSQQQEERHQTVLIMAFTIWTTGLLGVPIVQIPSHWRSVQSPDHGWQIDNVHFMEWWRELPAVLWTAL